MQFREVVVLEVIFVFVLKSALYQELFNLFKKRFICK